MSQRPFAQVDVFTATPYRGNPLAVVLDGSGLSDAQMQQFARWTNLSETTFILPPSQALADYRVRIFTPGGELPFAGHPTLGSCHAWLRAGGVPRSASQIVQECQLGLVSIRRDGSRLAFAAPALQHSAVAPDLLASISAALGINGAQVRAAQLLNNGPQWLGLLLDDPLTVAQLTPDHAALKTLGYKVGVAACAPSNPGNELIARGNREARAFAKSGQRADALAAHVDLYVRAFAAPIGVLEDPVTGSLNAALAQWLIADHHLPTRYVAAQGEQLGLNGRVHIERDAAGQVWVGGDTVTCIDGTVQL